jgi:diguanylate cyclase (GGDEF)-like protein/PAS domain S-box-containing protein
MKLGGAMTIQTLEPLQFDALIRHAPIGIAVIDYLGIYEVVNPAYCALYGYREDEMLGRSYSLVFPPEQFLAVLARHQRFLDEGDKLDGEWEVIRRDGARLSILTDSVRMPDVQGHKRRLVYVLDITQRKKMERESRQSAALLLDLAASLPSAMFRLLTPHSGHHRYTYISPGVEALFGVTPQQVCADSRALLRCILPADRPAHQASLQAAIQGQHGWEHEFQIRTPAGQLKWVHAKATPQAAVPGNGNGNGNNSGDLIWTGVLTDVSERHASDAALKASEESYRMLFETVPQGVVYYNPSGRIIRANSAAARILGLSSAQLLGKAVGDPFWRTIHEDGSDFPADQHPAMQALRTGHPVAGIVMGVVAPERDCAWIQVNAMPLFKGGQLSEVYASFEDITEHVRLERKLRREATTDFLTGMANRRHFMQRLNIEVDRIQRHPEMRSCVLTLDLDHFKRVNDSLGHAAGDAVLCHFTQLMSQQMRRLDVIGRIGGEEFAVLLLDTDSDVAMVLAERLRQRVALSSLPYAGHDVKITVSIGVSLISGTDADAQAVLVRADQALYAAKGVGRNCVRLAQLDA